MIVVTIILKSSWFLYTHTHTHMCVCVCAHFSNHNTNSKANFGFTCIIGYLLDQTSNIEHVRSNMTFFLLPFFKCSLMSTENTNLLIFAYEGYLAKG